MHGVDSKADSNWIVIMTFHHCTCSAIVIESGQQSGPPSDHLRTTSRRAANIAKVVPYQDYHGHDLFMVDCCIFPLSFSLHHQENGMDGLVIHSRKREPWDPENGKKYPWHEIYGKNKGFFVDARDLPASGARSIRANGRHHGLKRLHILKATLDGVDGFWVSERMEDEV